MKSFQLRLSYFFRVLSALSVRSQPSPEDFQWVRRTWRDIWLKS